MRILLISVFFLILYISYKLTFSIFYYLSFYSDIILITIKAEETLYSIFLIFTLISLYLLIPFFILIFLLNYGDALNFKELSFFVKFPIFYICGIVGSIFGFYVGTHFIIPFLLGYNSLINIDSYISLSNLIKNSLYYSFVFFIIFQLPFLIKILKDNNIIQLSKLKEYRKHIFIISLVISAIFSPIDFWSMFILCIPLYLSFEIGLLI